VSVETMGKILPLFRHRLHCVACRRTFKADTVEAAVAAYHEHILDDRCATGERP